LNVKESRWIDSYTGGSLNMFCQSNLVCILDLCPFLFELLVICVLFKLIKDS